MAFDEIIAIGRSCDLVWWKFGCLELVWDPGGVAEVMGHHDRGIKRSEIKCRNWIFIVSSIWLDDDCTFEFIAGRLHTFDRNDNVQSLSLPIQL